MLLTIKSVGFVIGSLLCLPLMLFTPGLAEYLTMKAQDLTRQLNARTARLK